MGFQLQTPLVSWQSLLSLTVFLFGLLIDLRIYFSALITASLLYPFVFFATRLSLYLN